MGAIDEPPRKSWAEEVEGTLPQGGGAERSVRHEGATRRTVDVRGDRLGAAGHSTLATPTASAIPFYSDIVNEAKCDFNLRISFQLVLRKLFFFFNIGIPNDK